MGAILVRPYCNDASYKMPEAVVASAGGLYDDVRRKLGKKLGVDRTLVTLWRAVPTGSGFAEHTYTWALPKREQRVKVVIGARAIHSMRLKHGSWYDLCYAERYKD